MNSEIEALRAENAELQGKVARLRAALDKAYLLSLLRWLSWSKPAGALRQAQGAGSLNSYQAGFCRHLVTWSPCAGSLNSYDKALARIAELENQPKSAPGLK